MADGKIYITISDQRGGGGGDIIPGVPKPKDKEDDNDATSDFIKHQFFSLIKETATKLVNNSISQIGNLTGDYQQQRQTQIALSILNKGKSIAVSFIGGAKLTGSMAGGVVSMVATVAAMGVNYGIEEYNNRLVLNKQNQEIKYIRDLSGLNSLKDGSRGTLD